ncbi:TetR/AcrR family transcriptional regulator [Falsiroseomonas tokyonensis]|uniref:TetR/AcrR family transcriptional regulator n=1 Tax=Falsiroseomonas tokyonensis TaxID=430521 RepID=A0ABV7BW74_9PROT|nr:TetR/AcrR family transcriptional regulator [Falsiroseomonas tokyonensis]MBU8539932.1 TetR/AcrR family transcriptional regulator [Falsiroseomonas tokyonensis]
MKPSAHPRRGGRPLSFDRDAALDAAMRLFWQQGYEATSVAELTQAMGITPPSLYAAFGDKRRLFRAAVDRYLTGARTVEQIIGEAPTARDAARDLLMAAALGDTGESTPPGCLLASSLVTGSAEAAALREELAEIRRGIEARLRARIAQEQDPGEAEALAGHVMAVIQGMSTLAKDGADRAKLLAIVETALAGWPPG